MNAYGKVREDVERAIDSFRNYTVVLGGCGNVGSLMARNLRARGNRVIVSDISDETPLEGVFRAEGIELDLGGHDPEVLRRAGTIAVTPSLENNRKSRDSLRDLKGRLSVWRTSSTSTPRKTRYRDYRDQREDNHHRDAEVHPQDSRHGCPRAPPQNTG